MTDEGQVVNEGRILTVGGVQQHHRDCSYCHGAGNVLCGTWSSNDPRGSVQRCEDCDGSGELIVDGCECDLCLQVAEDLETIAKAEAAHVA